MPLSKKQPEANSGVLPGAPGTSAGLQTGVAVPQDTVNQETATSHGRIGGTHKAGDKASAPLIKDGYWDRKEERDIRRDKDMAWSGLAQAAISSPYVAQFNVENTEAGLVALVVRITDKLLKARDEHNGK